MKILHFTHTFIPIYGGTTTRLINLLQNDGHNHFIITPGKGSKYIPPSITELKMSESIDNFKIYRPDFPDGNYKHKRIWEFISIPKEWHKSKKILLESANSIQPDLIYGHNPMEFALAAFEKSLAENIPFIFECHGLLKDSLYQSSHFPGNIYYKFLNSFLISYEKKILKMSKKIIVQTNTMKIRIQKEYQIHPDKVEVIYNGVDLTHFDYKKNLQFRDSMRKKYRFTEESKVIGYFGFLDNNNGILALLKKFEEMSQNFPTLKLLIIGRGPYSDACRQASERNPAIIYLPMVPYEDIPKYYSAIDFFIIPRPSNPATESLVPMKIFEAMAMKKLVIVSNVKGLTEIISNGVNGLVFEKLTELPDIIQRISTKLSKEDIIEEAYKTVLKKYTWDVARAKLSAIYKEAVSKKE